MGCLLPKLASFPIGKVIPSAAALQAERGISVYTGLEGPPVIEPSAAGNVQIRDRTLTTSTWHPA